MIGSSGFSVEDHSSVAQVDVELDLLVVSDHLQDVVHIQLVGNAAVPRVLTEDAVVNHLKWVHSIIDNRKKPTNFQLMFMIMVR